MSRFDAELCNKNDNKKIPGVRGKVQQMHAPCGQRARTSVVNASRRTRHPRESIVHAVTVIKEKPLHAVRHQLQNATKQKMNWKATYGVAINLKQSKTLHADGFLNSKILRQPIVFDFSYSCVQSRASIDAKLSPRATENMKYAQRLKLDRCAGNERKRGCRTLRRRPP